MITVESLPNQKGWDCEVEIDPDTDHASRHNVRVSRADLERWGGEGSPEDLVTRAFEFLLTKEEAHQILKSFELSDITRYHPEFDEAMAR